MGSAARAKTQKLRICAFVWRFGCVRDFVVGVLAVEMVVCATVAVMKYTYVLLTIRQAMDVSEKLWLSVQPSLAGRRHVESSPVPRELHAYRKVSEMPGQIG